MGRVNDWILGMEEDANWMSKAVFVRVHGIQNGDVWEKVHNPEMFYEAEPDLEGYEAMMEGYHG